MQALSAVKLCQSITVTTAKNGKQYNSVYLYTTWAKTQPISMAQWANVLSESQCLLGLTGW